MPETWTLLTLLAIAVYGAAIATAIHVVMSGRTPQGVVAWLFFLALLPYLAVPLYWVFGPRKYEGYIDARHVQPSPFDEVVDELRVKGEPFICEDTGEHSTLVAMERLVKLPFTGGNRIDVLLNGDQTFPRLVEAIDGARRYVLLQFFIVHDDGIGRTIANALLAARERGVRVHFLFDEIGSRKLSDAYRTRLRDAGIDFVPFSTTRRANRFQLNFRNHRKLVVVDGELAFTGGLNVGDEYMGRDPDMSPWRDTFFEVRGPSVQALQLAFLEDWHWATDSIPGWDWTPRAADDAGAEDCRVLVMPTGPADALESCSLLFMALIVEATERIWISTPYFVFDTQILHALQLAALRGVDVRVLLPERADYETAYYAGWSHHDEVIEAGCRLFRFEEGFMHQKAVLVDDRLALVGTMNLDNRSMRLNFELGLLIASEDFASRLGAILEDDFRQAREVTRENLDSRGFVFRFKARVARLFSPVL